MIASPMKFAASVVCIGYISTINPGEILSINSV
jgi:hypothetical protein